LELFKKSCLKIYGKPVKERHVQTEIDYWLNSAEELLFFTGCSLNSGLPYDLLGLVCGLAASNAKRNQKTGVAGWQRIFPELGYAQKRKFMNSSGFLEYFAATEELLIDATAQRLPRPVDNKSPQQYYSAKTNAYDKSHDYP